MDVEKLAYEMFKEEVFTCKKGIKYKIKKKFKDITEKQLNEVSLRIMNYQIDKYGSLKKNPNMASDNYGEGKRKQSVRQSWSQKYIIRAERRKVDNYHEEKNIERMYSSRKD